MLRRLVTTISCLAAATAVAAEPVELSSQAIRTTFSGSLLELDTPAGTIIPVRFGKDGLVSGEAGVLASVLGAKRDRGRWWTKDDKLCMKWFRWFEAETRCVSVRQDGTRVYWRGPNGRNGTGTIAEPAPVVAAPAPTPPARAEEAKIEFADAAPAPKVEAPEVEAAEVETAKAQEAEVAVTPSETPSIRFAAAALGAMSLVPPLTREPSHLLDGPGRSAIEAAPAFETAASDRSPAQAEQTAPAAHSSDPPPKAPETANGYASSTVILASFRVAGVDEDDMLNVRSGPSELYPSVGGLPPEGRGVKIVGPCEADWCPIRHGSVTGWVNRTYLAEEISGPAAATVSR